MPIVSRVRLAFHFYTFTCMTYTVDAVDQSIALLFLVAEYPGLGVSELARRKGISKARAYRLLYTLEQRNLVRKENDTKAGYFLGYSALYLGLSAQAQSSLIHAAKPVLAALGEALNETCQVRVREALSSVCVARWESSQYLRVYTKLGNRRPLQRGASGKVLLAFQPKVIEQLKAARQAEADTAALERIEQLENGEIAQIRNNGYAISQGEYSEDVVAFAVPVRDASGEVVAALSVSCPASRTPTQRWPALLQALQNHAQTFSQTLGYSLPDVSVEMHMHN